MEQSFTIENLPHDEQPKQRALRLGFEVLSEWELLCIVIGGKDALQTAHRLLARFGHLRQLASVSLRELQSIQGIGINQALRIKAVVEMGKRSQQSPLNPGTLLNSSEQVFGHYGEKLRDKKREYFYILLLDNHHRLIREELVTIGSLNFAMVHPREVFAPALRESAESIIVIHNHPSGRAAPSPEDIRMTKRLVEVGQMVGISVLDHIVIGDGHYTSFLEQHLIAGTQPQLWQF